MDNDLIPQYVISAIAETVAESETHASLDNLFMYADAPGEPPEGSKSVKALEWLRRINKEGGDQKFSIIGRILEKYMEVEVEESPSFYVSQEQIDAKNNKIQKIKNQLERAGLTYSRGGIISKGEGLATKTLSDLIKKQKYLRY